MALTDFLFNGAPPASVNTYGSSTSSLPAWYNDYTQGLISKANAIAAAPYEAYTGARLASTQDQQNQAYQNVGAQTNAFANQFNPQTGQITQGGFAPAFNMIQGAGQGNALGAPNSLANQTYQQALGPSVMGNYNTANQLTAGAAGADAVSGNINRFMNPYQNAVGSEINRLGTENLQNSLSNVNDQYIRGGGYGGSRMGVGIGNAIRANQRDMSGQQAALAQQGYNQALAASQADANRRLQAGQQLGGLAATQQQNLAGIANQLGQFGQSDLQRQLQAGQNLGSLAQSAAQTGTSQNAALEAAGQAQQQQQQRQLDLAYGDYQRQRQHPYEQISFLNNAIRGLQIPASQSTVSQGPASVYQPSPLAQLGAAGAGIAGLGKLFS